MLKDIFARKILADDFSLYLHRPTATDSTLAPEGNDAFYVLSPVPHLDSGTDWATMAETYRLALSRLLGETILPGLEQNLVTSKVTTPQDFQGQSSILQGRGLRAGACVVAKRLVQAA